MTGIIASMLGIKPAAAGRTANTITTVGNAQVDTAQSKFGGASALFDANGDRLEVAGFNIIGTAFTIECWVRVDSFAFTRQIITQDNGSSNGQGFQFRARTDQKLDFIYWTSSSRGSFVVLTTTSTISLNTWHHLAVVWTGSALNIYKDGTSIGNSSPSTIYASTAGFAIGGFYTSGTDPYSGHIDEVRISNIARYTANFTAPSAAFTNDSNTLLLVHCDGTDGSTTFTDDVS